jgi:hypothetical protein
MLAITGTRTMQITWSSKKSFVLVLRLDKVAGLHNSRLRFALWAWSDSWSLHSGIKRTNGTVTNCNE